MYTQLTLPIRAITDDLKNTIRYPYYHLHITTSYYHIYITTSILPRPYYYPHITTPYYRYTC